MDETNIIFLSNGKSVVLDDDDDIIISLVSNNEAEDTFVVPCPSGGDL